MDKSVDIPSGKEYTGKAVTAKAMETHAEKVLWVQMEAAFDKIRKNPELLATLKRMKDR